MLVLKVLVGLHSTVNLSFFSVTGWGIDWITVILNSFALEMNRDHSVIFEIASKYRISDSLVDHDGYSISSKKKVYFCVIDYFKAFDCVNHNKLWKILEEMGIPDHLTRLLRNLFADQEAPGHGTTCPVRTGHGTTDWVQIGKGVHQGYVLSPCLFNLYAEYIMRNAGLDEAQAGIKIARRNINNLRYADDTTLMEEREEALKNLLMKVKEESEKVGLKLNI